MSTMLGIEIFVEGVDPVVDIVAVHGLDGDRLKSWTDEKTGISWLKHPDFLPFAIPNSRILTFGYDVNTTAECTSSATLTEHADSLVECLARKRRETQTPGRPIIFIAHSLGGIVVKEALVHSKLDASSHTSECYMSTKAIFFFGTPHLGSKWSNVHATVLRIGKIFKSATEHIAKQLADNSDYLTKLQSQFARFRETIHVVYLYEEYPTPTPLGNKLLVPRDSAVPDNQRNAIKLCKNHVNMVKFTSSLDDDYNKVVSHLKGIIWSLEKARPKMSEEQQKQLKWEKDEISAWLKAPVASSYHHEEARKLYRDGTGEWFLQSEMFQRWMSSPNSFGWTYGKTGSGKTVLLSTMIQHLLDICRSNAKCAVAYHYCSFQDNPQALCGDVVASLMDQIQQQATSIPEGLLKLYNARDYDKLAPRSVERLLGPLRELASSLTATYILIDALDEFDASRIRDLLALLSSFKKWAIPSLHVLVTSQFHHLSIRESLKELTHPDDRLDLAADCSNESDIRNHIRSTLSESPHFRRRWEGNKNVVLTEIETALVEKSDGSFRWVDCQIRALSDCRTIKEVRTALCSLPRDLNETYSRILEGLTPGDRALACKMLIWLACTEERFTLGELAMMLSEDETHRFQVDDELSPVDVLQLCRDLTSLGSNLQYWERRELRWHKSSSASGSGITSRSVLVLAHSSVRDWLMKPASDFKPSIADLQTSHAIVATTMLSYVLNAMFPASTDGYWFLCYCARQCLEHATSGPTDEVRQLALQLLDEQNTVFSVWSDIMERGYSTPTSLYYASLFGLPWAVDSLLAAGAGVNATGGYYGNPLQAAADRGNVEVVQALLAAGADVNAATTQASGKSSIPLLAAIECRHVKIVQLLAAAGANANATGGKFGSPLLAAIDWGNMEVIKLLLAAGADVDAPGGESGSPLLAAITYRHVKLVQVLVAAGADVNATGGQFGSPLLAAIEYRHVQVVQALVAAGADVNATGGESGSLLLAAMDWGNMEVIKTLLAAEANINAMGGKFGSPLLAAIDQGNMEIVQMLLAAGADVNASGGESGSPLHAAAARGNMEIIELLLVAGTNVNATDGEFGTPLHAAAASGRMEVIELLLVAGADVNTTGGKYGSAIQAATAQWHLQVVEVLLQAGADVNIRNGRSTVFHAVFVDERYRFEKTEVGEKVAQRLIDAGADVNLLDEKGRSPLFRALQMPWYYYSRDNESPVKGWRGMVDLLTAAGALEIGEESGDNGGSCILM